MTNFVSRTSSSSSFSAGLSDRMQGPGGFYNIGNLIGLGSGLFLQILSMRDSEGIWPEFSDAFTLYLMGSPGATALTIAMLIHLCAGELYHRAWHDADCGPDLRLNRWADFVSGTGALFLAVSLTYFGDIWRAITATVLMAGGKFASALGPAQGWPVTIEGTALRAAPKSLKFDVFGLAVVLSRAPAIGALIFGLVATAFSGAGFGLGEAQGAILLLCYSLWTRADILLTRS